MRLRNHAGRIAVYRKILKQYVAMAGQLFDEKSDPVANSNCRRLMRKKIKDISLSFMKLSGWETENDR